MPFIAAFITSLLAQGVLKALLTRLAIYLGVGAISYLGTSALLSTVTSQLNTQAGSLSGFALVFLQMSGITSAFNLIWSAIVGRIALSLAGGTGAVKKLAFSGSTGLSIFG